MTSILNKARENHLSSKLHQREGVRALARPDAAAQDAAARAWRLIIETADNCLEFGERMHHRQSVERLMERFPKAMAGEEA